MDINEAYLFLADIAQKPKNGWLTPAQINAYFKMAQWQEYEYLLPLVEKDQYAMQQMQPFLKNDALSVIAQYATLPTDWYYYANSFSRTFQNVCGGTGITETSAVELVRANELSDRLNSNIPGRLPDVKHPIGLQQGNQIQIWPAETKIVNVYFWRKPSNPVWNYTTGTGRPVFDPTGSVNWEFPEGHHYKLCARVLYALSISLRETPLAQYANELEAKTPGT